MGPEEEYGSVSWHDVHNNRYFKAYPALVHVIKARQEGIMTIPKTGRMSSTRYTQLESLFNDQVADGVDEYPEYTEKALRQAELLRLEVTMRARASIRATAEAARVHLTAFLRALCQSAVLTRDYLKNMARALYIASMMNLPNIRASEPLTSEQRRLWAQILNAVGCATHDIRYLLLRPGRNYLRAPLDVVRPPSPVFRGPRATVSAAPNAAATLGSPTETTSPQLSRPGRGSPMAEIHQHLRIINAPHNRVSIRTRTGQLKRYASTSEELYIWVHQHHCDDWRTLFCTR